jgi:hypothetical protein
VADKLKAAYANGGAVEQETPQPMMQAFVDEVLEALKTESDMFYHRGCVEHDGNGAFDVSLEGLVSYVPGLYNFCKLYCIKCEVSPVYFKYIKCLLTRPCLPGRIGGRRQFPYTGTNLSQLARSSGMAERGRLLDSTSNAKLGLRGSTPYQRPRPL